MINKSGKSQVRLTLVTLFTLLLLPINLCLAASPEATNIELTSITDTSIIITWQTSTDASTSGIKYGISTSDDNTYVDPATDPAQGGAYVTNHYLTLTGLSPGITYYYKITSTNAGGTYESTESTFTTLSAPSGDYLFSFAILSDIEFADGMANTTGANGKLHEPCRTVLGATVAEINQHDPAFTLILGDILEDAYTYTTSQIDDLIQPTLSTLEGQNVTGDGNQWNYLPIPGNNDKSANYVAGRNWISGNLRILTNNRYGYSPTLESTDSIFNYSFDYRGYHFVMLDTVLSSARNCSGEANISWLSADLNSNSGEKTFIFSHFPTYNVSDYIPPGIDIDPSAATTAEAALNIINYAAFGATLDAHAANIAAVYQGHLHDNYKVTKTHGAYSVPYSRVASLSQFPLGYTIVKVYTNGYMQTFYKIHTNDYSETARTLITSAEGLAASFWQALWLGASSARNYVHTYSTITSTNPTVAFTFPAAGSTQSGNITLQGIATSEVGLSKVNLYVDSSFLVTVEVTGTSTTFSHSLNTTSFTNGSHTILARVYDLLSATGEASLTFTASNEGPNVQVISPNGGESWRGGIAQNITWSATGELAANPISIYYSTDSGSTYPNTIATGVSNEGTYSWTVPDTYSTTARVKIVCQGTTLVGSDESNANFTLTYADSDGPAVSITHFSGDITSNTRPTITGMATDEKAAVASVEVKVDSGTWAQASAVSGSFSASSEAYYYSIPTSLTTGSHTIYARGKDAYDNYGSTESYTFTVATDRPTLVITVSGKTIYSGDAISSTPSIEGTITSVSGVDTSTIKIIVDSTQEVTSESITITPITAPYSYSIHYQYITPIAAGTHDLKVQAANVTGTTGTWDAVSVKIAAANTNAIESRALNYPNPFSPSLSSDPGAGGTYISYELSNDANVKIMIFDIMSTKLREINCTSGGTGGSAGYNEVYFNGLTDAGRALGNGIYIYLLVIDGQVKAKGKLTVVQP
jgi:hypothetical protein